MAKEMELNGRLSGLKTTDKLREHIGQVREVC